jgi:hypothetical protein
MTLSWTDKFIVAALESSYGVDASPTGSNAIEAIDVRLTPMQGQDLSRNRERDIMVGNTTIPVDLHMELAFKVELQGSGTAGTAPAWGPLMRACGFAETIVANTSVTYNPVRRNTTHDSITLHMFIDDERFVLVGARGNVRIVANASGIPMLEFSFKGLWTLPASATAPNPVYTAYLAPQAVSDATTPTFTLDGTDFVMNTFAVDIGNSVEGRFRVNSQLIMIASRQGTVEMQVEAQALSVFNPFDKAEKAAMVDVQIVHGTTAGRICTVNVDAMQMQRPDAPSGSQGITDWNLRGIPTEVSGNDQVLLTLT